MNHFPSPLMPHVHYAIFTKLSIWHLQERNTIDMKHPIGKPKIKYKLYF